MNFPLRVTGLSLNDRIRGLTILRELGAAAPPHQQGSVEVVQASD